MSQICPLCQVNSPRTTPSDCCQIREWANAPKHLRHAEYAGVVATETKEAAEAWKSKVHAEMKRLRGLR